MKLERRFISTHELRAATVNGKLQIRGYASVFNSPTDDMSTKQLGFRECVKPGAFSRAISEKQDVRCLVNHDPNQLLGRTKNGTLRLKEDNKGLWYECDMPDTSYARDAYALIKNGTMSQCSFSFILKRDRWSKGSDGIAERELIDLDALDVSPVTYPVYTDTEVDSVNHDGLVNANHVTRMFPEGVPVEMRSRLQACGVALPSDPEIENMKRQWETAYRSALADLIPE
jgi:HK97 family phage prohead protease